MSYTVHIGLEIHVQLKTQSKIFCPCPVKTQTKANTNICPVCMGYPGTLPTLNREALSCAYLVAQSLHCRLAEYVCFDRKSYFYPDLPKNYQISQFNLPLGRGGYFEYESSQSDTRIDLKEVHLEEDAGKMIHGDNASYCDYNRAGTPLLEIVTQPHFRSPQGVHDFLQQFRRFVRYLSVCDGNMEEGSLRCDANVSLSKEQEKLGSKVEIKNLNSFRFVHHALDYELIRQKNCLDKGDAVVQETRLWNENKDCTEALRSKEDSQDYRYLPEPDMPAFVLPSSFFVELEVRKVELPFHRKKRLSALTALDSRQLDAILDEKEGADFFESVAAEGIPTPLLSHWMQGDLQRILRKEGLSLSDVPQAFFIKLLRFLDENVISRRSAQMLLKRIISERVDPEIIIKKENLFLLRDPTLLREALGAVIKQNEAVVTQYYDGHRKSLDFLVGKVMQETQGRADPTVLRNLLVDHLEGKKKKL